MEQGPIEEDISTQASNMGRSKPEVMQNKPQPLPGNTLYLQAFYDLDGERQIGMSVGRIPWSAVQYYATLFEFSGSQTMALHYIIGRMDAANLRHISAGMQTRKLRK